MKNITKILTFSVVFIALAVFAFTTTADTSAQNQNQSVNGQGTLLVQDENGKTVRRQFAVNARSFANGSVKGHAVLHNPAFTGTNGQKYELQVDISCLKIVGNIAFMGGLTRRTNDPNLDEAVYFSVQDNGEPGKNSDQISRAFFFDDDPNTTGDPQLCQGNVVGDFPMEPIDGGNIQVK